MRRMSALAVLMALASLGAAADARGQQLDGLLPVDASFGQLSDAAFDDEGFDLREVLLSDEGFDLGDVLLDDDLPFDVGGWTQWGYTNRSTGLFNKHPHRFNNDQSWIFAEKKVDGSEGIDFGGRIDFLYGVDASDTQGFGNHPGAFDFNNGDDGPRGFWANHGIYGYAIPQLYGEVAYGDLSVKAGHFFTLLGYEVVPATGNFFYSHSFTMNNSEAFTHTGVLATHKTSESVTVYGGWTAGWDTGFDRFHGGNNFLGGFSLALTDDVTFTYITTIGNFGSIGRGYSHSIVIDFALTDQWNYVFQTDVLRNDHVPGAAPQFANDTFDIDQFLFYHISEQWAVGGRAEWWKSNGNSIYALTAGVNFIPVPNVRIRPELRYQWDPGTQGGALDPSSNRQPIFGIDAILSF